MNSETIHNPDLWLGVRRQENYAPVFSHFTVDFSGPLFSSENPIINNLLALGFEVRETVTSYFCAFPTQTLELARPFKAQEREEYQVDFDGGFLRWRWHGAEDIVYLTLFRIDRERRGKGLARKHFPEVIDALFRAGVKFVIGEVAPSWCEPADFLNVSRLLRFYVRQQGFTHLGNNIITKNSPYPTEGKFTA